MESRRLLTAEKGDPLPLGATPHDAGADSAAVLAGLFGLLILPGAADRAGSTALVRRTPSIDALAGAPEDPQPPPQLVLASDALAAETALEPVGAAAGAAVVPLVCPTCQRPLGDSHLYFRLLESVCRAGHGAAAAGPSYYAANFREVAKLGVGSFGVVYRVQHVLCDTPLGDYACKIVSLGVDRLPAAAPAAVTATVAATADADAPLPWLYTALREVSVLERLRHPNVVAYKHCWIEDRCAGVNVDAPAPHLFILLELGRGGSLANLQCGTLGRRLQPAEILNVLSQAAAGLGHLHALGFLSRDVKCSNFLLDALSDPHPCAPCAADDNDAYDAPYVFSAAPPAATIYTTFSEDQLLLEGGSAGGAGGASDEAGPDEAAGGAADNGLSARQFSRIHQRNHPFMYVRTEPLSKQELALHRRRCDADPGYRERLLQWSFIRAHGVGGLRVLLADFGQAGDGAECGTEVYLAPELFAAPGARCTAFTDVYSLGITVLVLLFDYVEFRAIFGHALQAFLDHVSGVDAGGDTGTGTGTGTSDAAAAAPGALRQPTAADIENELQGDTLGNAGTPPSLTRDLEANVLTFLQALLGDADRGAFAREARAPGYADALFRRYVNSFEHQRDLLALLDAMVVSDYLPFETACLLKYTLSPDPGRRPSATNLHLICEAILKNSPRATGWPAPAPRARSLLYVQSESATERHFQSLYHKFAECIYAGRTLTGRVAAGTGAAPGAGPESDDAGRGTIILPTPRMEQDTYSVEIPLDIIRSDTFDSALSLLGDALTAEDPATTALARAGVDIGAGTGAGADAQAPPSLGQGSGSGKASPAAPCTPALRGAGWPTAPHQYRVIRAQPSLTVREAPTAVAAAGTGTGTGTGTGMSASAGTDALPEPGQIALALPKKLGFDHISIADRLFKRVPIRHTLCPDTRATPGCPAMQDPPDILALRLLRNLLVLVCLLFLMTSMSLAILVRLWKRM